MGWGGGAVSIQRKDTYKLRNRRRQIELARGIFTDSSFRQACHYGLVYWDKCGGRSREASQETRLREAGPLLVDDSGPRLVAHQKYTAGGWLSIGFGDVYIKLIIVYAQRKI